MTTDTQRHPALPVDLPGLEPGVARVLGELRRAMQLHRQLMLRALGEQPTPPGQAMCLQVVASHDGATQREIGDLLHLAPPTVTAILKRMERAGTVAREADPTDQRVTRVHLTRAGRDLYEGLGARIASRVGGILDTMPAVDRDQLARLLGDLADRMAVALDDATAAAGHPAPGRTASPTTGRHAPSGPAVAAR